MKRTRPALALILVAAACGNHPEPPASPGAARPSGPPQAAAPAPPSPPSLPSPPSGAPTPTAAAPSGWAAQPLPTKGTAVPPGSNDGPGLYNKYCALCHGPAAQGYAADNAPSLVSPTFVATVDDAFYRVAIERGRPGTAMGGYGATVGGPLPREDVDTLLAWLRSIAPAPHVQLPNTRVRGNVRKGQAVFEANCAKCHGSPKQRATAVHLFNPVLLATASDHYLRYAIVKGRPGTKMEPFEGKLPAAAIDDVVAWLRSQAPRDLAAALAASAAAGQEPARPIKGPVVVNPRGKQASFTLKDDRLVSMDQVKAALDAKRRIVFVDARTPSDFNRLHIPGAVSIPYYDMKELDKLPRDGTWIVAYCACPHHASGVVYEELRRRGVKTSAVLDEGVFAWQQKGYPVVAAPGSLPIPAPPAITAGDGGSTVPLPLAPAPPPTLQPATPHALPPLAPHQ